MLWPTETKIIIAAGFLLGDTVKTFAQQYPNIKFAITDDPVAAHRRVQERGGHHLRG